VDLLFPAKLPFISCYLLHLL